MVNAFLERTMMDLLKGSVELIYSALGILSILFGAGIVPIFTRRHFTTGRRFLISGACARMLMGPAASR